MGTAVIQPQHRPIELAVPTAVSSRVRLVALAALLAALLGVFWVVRPQYLGGDTSYVVSRGESMNPSLSDGDLIVLRRADSYAVGDVVAYESPSLGRIVLHRIAGIDGGRYLMRGDANDYVDPDSPTPSQIIGRSWARVPGAGGVAASVRQPAILALGIAFFASLVGAGLAARKPRERAPRVAAAPAVVTPRWTGVWWDDEDLAA